MVYTYKYINIQVGPLDWPEWASDASEHVSYKGYVKDIVKGSCENFMRAKVASHVSPLKYLSLPSSDMAVCQNLVPLVNIKMVLIGIDPYPYPEKVATQVHVGHAGGASRLLAPVVWLYPAGHVDFRPSKASIRWCIFCGKRYGNIYIYAHVFSNCAALDAERALVPSPDLKLFYCNVLEASFPLVVAFAHATAQRARAFWRQHGMWV